MKTIRLLKICLAASVAIYISMVALSNIFEYSINFNYLSQIMRMEHVFEKVNIERAVFSPILHHAAFITIIIWEVISAVILWIGVIQSLKSIHDPILFSKSKEMITIGLLLLLILFSLVFVAIGGQYFASWQSQTFNSVRAVTPYLSFVGLVTILWVLPEKAQ